jgi:hypothetical protein
VSEALGGELIDVPFFFASASESDPDNNIACQIERLML